MSPDRTQRIRIILALIATALVTMIATQPVPVSAAQTQALAAALEDGTQICTVDTKPNGGFTLNCDPLPVTPTPSASTATPSPTATTPSPTASPTTPSPSSSTSTASPTPSPTTSTPPPGGFPTATSVGVPAGWTPTVIRSGWTITAPGVYTDIRVHGSINVRALGVTLRRVEVVGGVIDNEDAGRCYNNLLLEDVTVKQGATYTNAGADGVIGPGGYTARRVAIVDRVEGFRVGGYSNAGCGPVLIENSYSRATPPRPCGDWHGDALQGYDAPPLTIRNSTLILDHTGCSGTSAYFYPVGQQPAVVDGLLVQGGGFTFRSDSSVSVRGLRIVNNTWIYSSVERDVTCRRVTLWQDNAISDAVGNVIRALPTCASQ